MTGSESHHIMRWNGSSCSSCSTRLIAEDRLFISVQDTPYTSVMRTPGSDDAHVAGFCLTGCLVDSLDDFASLSFFIDGDTSSARVFLTQERYRRVSALMQATGFISQTSSAVYSLQSFPDSCLTERTPCSVPFITPDDARLFLLDLHHHQPLREQTGSAHAVALYNQHLKLLCAAEDVGRHNALDKAVGRLFLDGRLDDAGIAVLSSRVSLDMILKLSRTRIAVILSISRPTAAAVASAEKLGITLACLSREKGGEGIMIFSGADRFS